MGTNFYWHEECPGACEHCALAPIHVGKRSAGWSFGFRAHRHRRYDDAHPEWGWIEQSPFGFPVESRADWRKVFTGRTGVLRDEYGSDVADPVAWLDALDAPDTAQQEKEWSREWMGPHWRLDPDRDWRDADGFRFHAGEFS